MEMPRLSVFTGIPIKTEKRKHGKIHGRPAENKSEALEGHEADNAPQGAAKVSPSHCICIIPPCPEMTVSIFVLQIGVSSKNHQAIFS
jgi:hypothetical protein